MLIPSIDLMGGKVVQLVQGERKALEYDDPAEWIARFRDFPLVQLIDLDAAMGKGSNRELIALIAAQLPCQVGGGVRSIARAKELLAAGARRVIVGSALFAAGSIQTAFAAELAASIGREHVLAAVDARAGRVAVHGWAQQVDLTPAQAITALDPHCAGFLYTHIDTEGTLTGFPLETARPLRSLTSGQLIVAGGIRSQQEVDALHALGIDAVVGMAIYTGLLKV